MASRVTKEKCLENCFKNVSLLIDLFNDIFPEEGLTVYKTLLNRKRKEQEFDIKALTNLKNTYAQYKTNIDTKDETFFATLIKEAETNPEMTPEGKQILVHLAKIYNTKRSKIPAPKKELIWEKIKLVCRYADKYFTF